MREKNNTGYSLVKRILDMLLSAVGLLVLLIPFGVIAVVLYLDDPGPVLFRQFRVGRAGKQFQLYKFRTMKQDCPHSVATRDMHDPDRYVTRVGHFLRKTSLDELPQLINVLRGDMSLVGPRPLIPEETDIHEMRLFRGVYTLRPGLTGLAQINGRDVVQAEEKVRYDVCYLEHFGFWLDLKILLATVPKVLGGEGVVEGFQEEEGQEPKIPV